MPVPIVCSQCGATYENIKLAPGAAFACGDCGRELHAPGAQQPAAGVALPVVQPTVRAPGTPPPVAQPTTATPPPIVQPKAAPAEGAPPVMQPKAAPANDPPPVVPKRPAPAIQSRPKPGAQPTPRRRATSGRGQQPAKNAPPGQGRRSRPGARRRTTSRPHTRVINTDDMQGELKTKSNKPIILASCFGAVALAVLIFVIATLIPGGVGARYPKTLSQIRVHRDHDFLLTCDV